MDGDSILYENKCAAARTAWLHRRADGTLKVEMVPGFQIDPPADWHEGAGDG